MDKNILILCTGNSARSQMAEGILKSLDPSLHVFSAGTNPARQVSPYAILVMSEIGIDIASHRPKNVDQFLGQPFDYVLTVCDNAKERCPVFHGDVKQRIHLHFEDPAEARGTEEEVASVFRRIRDEIRTAFTQFYIQRLSDQRK